MKLFKHLSIVILALFIFQSCDEVEELSNVDIATEIVKQFNITSDQGGLFQQTIVLNLSENDDLDQYLDRIKDVKITKADYAVVAFPGSQSVAGTLSVSAAEQMFGPFVHNNFKDDFDNQAVFNLEGNDKLNIIAVQLKDTKQLAIQITGTAEVSEAFTMTIEVAIDLVVTAQAL